MNLTKLTVQVVICFWLTIRSALCNVLSRVCDLKTRDDYPFASFFKSHYFFSSGRMCERVFAATGCKRISLKSETRKRHARISVVAD